MKNKISFKFPAYLSNFSTRDDGRTMAKLKAFSVGETEDGRVFPEEFAHKLAETLAYCPVVTYYSDISKDFKGHNRTQYIYGIVPGDAGYTFEKCEEDGKVWCYTDVLLYTDRGDNIGEVANKIVGKAHSLEMDPNTVNYEMFEENGHRKIKFTEGRLIGLSVLGDEQNPAFKGSEFFEAANFEEMKGRFVEYFNYLEEQSRGVQMENEKFEAYANFLKLSYTDKMRMASDKLADELGDYCLSAIVDMDDTCFTAAIYDFSASKEYFKRFNYSLEDEVFALGDSVEVYQKLLSAEEMKYLESYGKEQAFEEKEPEEDPEDVEDEEKEEGNLSAEDLETLEEEKEKEDKEEQNDENMSTETEEGEEDEDNDESSKEDETKATCSSDTSALSDSERVELEGYRKLAKMNLINEYDGLLESEVLESFRTRVDEYDFKTLESELAIKFSKWSRENKNAQAVNMPLSFADIPNAASEESSNETALDRLIKRYVRK